MSSHSGKKERRKAREAERIWRQKKEYDDRIARLEERRRQIMVQLEPDNVDSEGDIPQYSFSSLRENCLRIREALEDVVEACENLLSGHSTHLQAVGEDNPMEAPDTKLVKKNKVLVFKSDGTPKGEHSLNGVFNPELGEDYSSKVGRLHGTAQTALREIKLLLDALENDSETLQVLPALTDDKPEESDAEGMLDVLKSPMVSELIGNLLTSLKK